MKKRLFSVSDFADAQIRFWCYYIDIYYYAPCILLPSPACTVPALAGLFASSLERCLLLLPPSPCWPPLLGGLGASALPLDPGLLPGTWLGLLPLSPRPVPAE